jgi:hypothetical protein
VNANSDLDKKGEKTAKAGLSAHNKHPREASFGDVGECYRTVGRRGTVISYIFRRLTIDGRELDNI